MPLVAVCALGLVRVGIAIRNELAVELAAREGARAASVAASAPGAARTAATNAVALPISVHTASSGRVVTVTVTYVDRSRLPLLGALIGPVRHRASVSMRVEPP